MFKRKPISMAMGIALGLASLSVVWGTSVYAQEQQSEDEDMDLMMEEVVVTGSSIKRVQAEGALPVQMFSQEDIQVSGATSVTDFVQRIPAMQGFTSIGDSVGGGGGGITTASIHDVGEQYTLVLLNGHRVAPANSGTTIDLNSIPLSAIERIEVLTDGASALYGADAIAGVVNFILKKGEAPLELVARYSEPQHAGGKSYNASISKGWGNLQSEGYSFFLTVSYDKQEQLAAKQRDFAKTGILSGTFGDLAYDFFNGSSRSVPPNVDVRFNTLRATSFSPYFEDTGQCPPDHQPIGRQCFFDYTTTVLIAPQVERDAVYGTGEYRIGDSDWSVFADLAYTDVSTLARIAPYPSEFRMSTDNPYYAQYVEPFLTPEQVADGVTNVNVKYRLYDVGNRTYDYAAKSTHIVGGVRGSTGEWDMSAAVTYSKQDQDQDYKAGFPLAEPFNAGLEQGLFDPFPYTLGTMPEDQLEALRATQYVGNYNSNKIDMVAFEANAQRPLFNMGGGASIISVGLDYRDTGYSQTANQAVANAEILFDDPQPEFDLSRSNWGAYAEFLAPVLNNAEITASVRYDSIEGVSDKFTGVKSGGTEDKTTYKIGGKWQVIDSLALRASFGTGFRVATMREIAQPQIDFGVTSGTYDCPFNAGYDPLGYFAAGHVCADGLQFEVFQGGNTNLAPENSEQWNVGLIWQPTRNFTAGLNYWSVSLEDGVSSVSESLIFGNPDRYIDLFTTKFKISNGLTYVAILDAPINIGKLENEGLDWDLTYTGDMGFATFTAALMGTYLNKSEYTVPGTENEWTTSLNKFGVNDAVSFENIVNGSFTASFEKWEHTLMFSYKDGYTDQFYSAEDWCFFYDPNTGDCADGALEVPSYTKFDWRTSWRPIDPLTLVFRIDNLFDEEPPLSLRVNGAGHQLGYDPRYADAYLRTYVLQAIYRY